MFKIIRISMEGLIVLLVLGFLAIWIVLQEYGTLLSRLLIIYLVFKLLQYLARTRPISEYIPPNRTGYPRHGVSEPVALDRYSLLNRPLDDDRDV